MRWIAECGRLTSEQPRCAACGRRLRCVYTVDDSGWVFMFGRRCYDRLNRFLKATR